MAIDFPNSPTTGDTYTVNGRTWKWDGTTWAAYGNYPDPTVFKVDTTSGYVGINNISPTVALDVTGSAAFSGSITVDGDFTVSGTTTTINTTQLNVEDNIITLNYGVTGTPSLDAGIEVERGDETNAQLLWDESAGAWVIANDLTIDAGTLHVDSTNNRVGIGTTTPSELLDVDAGTSGSVSLTTSGGRTIQLTANDSDPFLSVGSTTAHSASIMTNGIRRIIVLDDGKVGIGTSSPGYLLDVNGDARISSNGTTDLFVKTTANSSYESRITIGGARTASNSDNLAQLRFWNYANQSTNGDYEAARISAVDPSADYANGRGALVFKTSSGGTLSEYMRIDENGNVGIGTSSPSEALDVAGKIQSNNYIIAGKGNGGVALTHNDGQGNANVTFNHVDGTPEQTGNAARIVVNTDSSTSASMSFEVRSGVTGGVNVGTTLSFRIYETSVDVVGALSKGSGSFKIPHPILEGTHNLVHSFIEGPRADLIYRGKATLVDGQATVNIDESAGMTEGTFVALNRDIQCWVTNDSGWTAVRGTVSGNILTIEAQDSSCADSVSWLVIGERHDQHMYDTGWTDDEGRVIVEPEIVTEEAS